MKGSRVAPLISIVAGLLWFYAAVMMPERRSMSVILGVVFLFLGLIQLKVNRERFKDEKSSSEDKDAG